MKEIRIGISGYGKLARGAEMAINTARDMELTAVFSRRVIDHPLYRPIKELDKARDEIDVLLLCGGSATDLPNQGPGAAALFNTVDTFDTHASIPEYFDNMNVASFESGHLSLISAGWDPGLFSLNRVLMDAVLPDSHSYTFWGRGVSQGHSDAVRRVEGVKDAVQYTVPLETALRAVRSGDNPDFTAQQMHKRVCYIVPDEGADRDKITDAIVNMPNYFAGYPTEVHFITAQEMIEEHAGLPHGGIVSSTGFTAKNERLNMEFSLSLDSNPALTGSVAAACARAVYRLYNEGKRGAITLLDVPVGYLSEKPPEELREHYL